MLRCALPDKRTLRLSLHIMEQLTLTTKLKKPLTPAEWLRSSMSWAVASVLGWLLLSTLLSKCFGADEIWADWLLLGAAAIVHLLIWYKSVLTTWETVVSAVVLGAAVFSLATDLRQRLGMDALLTACQLCAIL
jgi:branched-subunit amino acid transport protein